VCSSDLFEGNLHQFTVNCIAAFVAVVFSFAVTYIIAQIVDRTMGLRATADEEYVGMDISQHGERV
jgi:Amt family ammonium transporter